MNPLLRLPERGMHTPYRKVHKPTTKRKIPRTTGTLLCIDQPRLLLKKQCLLKSPDRPQRHNPKLLMQLQKKLAQTLKLLFIDR